jgi:hypothetical protein
MASFPNLRPDRGLAHAERRVARSSRRLAVLLAALTGLSVVAFVAVSELATLHGQKALKPSAFPAKAVRSLLRALALAGIPTVRTEAA